MSGSPAPEASSVRSTAESVISYLAAQDEALRAGERALRAGDPGGVHASRVGARRARSTLRTFAGLFPAGPRATLDDSLREYAAELGELRDLQVLRAVLAEHAKDDLAASLEEQVDQGLRVGWQRLERDLATARHRDLQAAMTSVLLGSASDGLDLDRCVRKAGRRAERRLVRAGTSIERLHDARKAAKRARYAVEATGGPASLVARYERLQGLLGRHHDLSVAAAYVDRAGLPASLRADAAALGVHLRTEAESVRQEAIACLP